MVLTMVMARTPEPISIEMLISSIRLETVCPTRLGSETNGIPNEALFP